MNESTSLQKIPKKIQIVIDAYEDMLKWQQAFRHMQFVTSKPLPKYKARQLENQEAKLFTKFWTAQQKWQNLWKKLNKKDIATAIKIRKELEK